ncbi:MULTISPECIES: sulfite dehydrogenase [Acidiphilium]|uniref:Sulfur dehydrogenase subunit SoxC n=1 Tax=Acidiphilium rubrum TaxID=526 RepID=A0A8G2CNN7_ACIRU|nr:MULTISPECIES: sulfite dehydrogenase [Acidiphilium]SIR47678.1 sulfur dehydrogenase subunit SoxC [Acidiphilium rubrum]
MTKPNRRDMFRLGAAAGAALIAASGRGARAASPPGAPPADNAWSNSLGHGVDSKPYGSPSPFEKNVVRRYVPWLSPTRDADASMTPLQDQPGIITSNGVFFERYHAGVPQVDPKAFRLMISGRVKKPLLLTLDQLMRYPSVSRIHFIECPANGATEWPAAQLNSLQLTHGMIGCAEWTGVLLSTLLDEAGLYPDSRWVTATGSDGAHMNRSLPMMKCLDDCMIAWGQNGEAVRPEQGYPARLVVPGWQGNVNVKWLRQIQVGREPWITREETSEYSELLGDGTSLGFTWVMDAKSVITFPCPEKPLTQGPGFYEIRGLAWSGRGKVKYVDISLDGGVNFQRARLDNPILDKCMTRFTLPWWWDGKVALIQSRVTDETGYVQPTIVQKHKFWGADPVYENNSIQTWQVLASGAVNNVQLS